MRDERKRQERERKRVMFPDPVSRFFPPILMASSMLLGDEEDRRRRYREISRDDIGSATRQRELFFRVLSREGKRTRLKKKKKKKLGHAGDFSPQKLFFFYVRFVFSFFPSSLLSARWPRRPSHSHAAASRRAPAAGAARRSLPPRARRNLPRSPPVNLAALAPSPSAPGEGSR